MKNERSLFGENDSGATFSLCGKYRYRLWRSWPAGDGTINFLMLNPSTADGSTNDPTVERCERRARQWGFSRLIVTNLFAYRATDPDEMKSQADPVGPENDAAILTASRESDLVVCAWGAHGSYAGRADDVARLLAGKPLYALRVTSGGMPAHPLYLPYELRPQPWGGVWGGE